MSFHFQNELEKTRLEYQKLEEELEKYYGFRNSLKNTVWFFAKGINEYIRRIYHVLKSKFFPHKRQTFLLNYNPYEIKYSHRSTKTKKKILHAIPSFTTGGSQQLIVDIIEGTQSEYTHSVITHNNWGKIGYKGVPIIELSFIRSVKAMEKVLRLENPDIIHVHYWGDRKKGYAHWQWYHFVFQAASNLRFKIIQNCNNPLVPYLSTKIFSNVFVSNYAKKYFGISNFPNEVIYPGSNFSLFNRNNNEKLPHKCIGMVYRLDRDKLNENSIDIFIEVVKQQPDIKAIIVGSGYYENLYRKKVKDNCMENSIEFTGMVSYEELPNIYKKFSVFVAPVHKESFGQVTPFAMNMRIPVVGYNIGALEEIIGNQNLLALHGDVKALANIIIDLLNNPEKCEKIGIYNEKRAKELFSTEQMVKKYKLLYNKAVMSNKIILGEN